ncbi:MAG: hypothetical protein L0312_26095 [Acidobacteria bacterium]|nr:hypothetical protein [Acidobacteriota bacterium]
MNTQRGIASFVLRMTQDLWQDAQGEPHVQWRGQIRHVQDEDEASFTDFADAVTFIQGHLTKLTLDNLSGGTNMEQEKVLRESFKLWEQFASTYNKMMFEAMEKTIQQSEAIKQQMDQAVERSMKTWKLPAAANPAEILAALDKLSAQVEALTEKVVGLEKSLQKSAAKKE